MFAGGFWHANGSRLCLAGQEPTGVNAVRNSAEADMESARAVRVSTVGSFAIVHELPVAGRVGRHHRWGALGLVSGWQYALCHFCPRRPSLHVGATTGSSHQAPRRRTMRRLSIPQPGQDEIGPDEVERIAI
jgi:hypothetical protein